MTKPLPTIPGFEPITKPAAVADDIPPFDPGPAPMGHNNPPEPTIDLDALKDTDATKLFKENLIVSVVDGIKEEAAGFSGDITTEAGRKAIKSFAYKLTRSRTILDEKGKELNAGLRLDIDETDKKRRKMRDDIDGLIAAVEKPLTDWDAREKLRKETLDADLRKVRDAIAFFNEPTLEDIDKRITTLNAFSEYDWQDLGDIGSETVRNGLIMLNEKRALRVQQIAEQVELQRLRDAEAVRQEEERKKREAEEQAERDRQAEAERQRLENERIEREKKIAEEAAAKAEADKKAAEERAAQAEKDRIAAEEKAAADLKAQKEQAERDRVAAAQKAEADKKAAADKAAQDERDRIAAEQKAKDEAEAKRKADQDHRRKINGEVWAALVKSIGEQNVAALTADQIKAVIIAIASGHVPHTNIRY